MMDQFTTGDIDIFGANWGLGVRTKGKRLTTLRDFFRFCARRKWVAESPVSEDVKPPAGFVRKRTASKCSGFFPIGSSSVYMRAQGFGCRGVAGR